jgi:geranylgeranyl diphosphate synthase type II
VRCYYRAPPRATATPDSHALLPSLSLSLSLQWIHKHKTGALLRAAVTCGAVLAGASKAEVDACETYATDIGLAFQVADDILDITATSEDLGKTAGKDLEADKATYPKFLGLDGAKKEAKRLVEDAVVALEPFGEGAAPLRGIATYIIERKN